MRDTKSLMLLLVSLLLVLVSFVLIWTWGYSYYAKKEGPKTIIVSPDAAAITDRIRDSLQKEYTATLSQLDMQLDSTLNNSDSLKTQLDARLADIRRVLSVCVPLD